MIEAILGVLTSIPLSLFDWRNTRVGKPSGCRASDYQVEISSA
jgi:hypothetical protein